MFGKKKKKENIEVKETNIKTDAENGQTENIYLTETFEKDKNKKKKKVKVKKSHPFLEKYNFKLLQKEIQSYGYNYSFKNFVLQSLGVMGIVGAIAYFIDLKLQYIAIIWFVTLLLIPLVIRSQFQQLYEMKRFEMVVNYLDNVIPIFKNTPIITSAWKDVLDLTEDEMKNCVQAAYDKVMNNTDDPNVEESAFEIIESHFPNSRIHSVHQMMLTVEKQNDVNYHSSVDNMYFDVQSWISRVYQFQKELSNKKKELIFLSLLTMGANCLFILLYNSTEAFAQFTQNTVYQISSCIFMSALMWLICVFQMKMNGKWLINDRLKTDEKKDKKSLDFINKYKNKVTATRPQKIGAIIFVLIGIGMFIYTDSIVVLSFCAIVAYMLWTQNKREYNSHVNRIRKTINIEFPIWLRDVALNLQNLTILRAIEHSKQTSSYVMNYYIDIFLKKALADPSNITPYNEFLEEYGIRDVKASMKVLFTQQSLNHEQASEQTNSLIMRNQELLAKSEKIRNEATMGNLRLLGFVPVMLFCAQMLVSMGVLFSYMMNMMNSAVNI